MTDFENGGYATGSRGATGNFRGVYNGQEGYFDAYDNFHPDPPRKTEDPTPSQPKPYVDVLEDAYTSFSNAFEREYAKENAKRLNMKESAGALGAGVVVGTLVASFDNDDPAGSLARGAGRILCLVGMLAINLLGVFLFFLMTGAGTASMRIAGYCLLAVDLIITFGLLRIMMGRRFLPHLSSLSMRDEKNAAAAASLAQKQAHAPRKSLVLAILGVIGVLFVVMIALMVILT